MLSELVSPRELSPIGFSSITRSQVQTTSRPFIVYHVALPVPLHLFIFEISYQELHTSKISEIGFVGFLATTPSHSHYLQFPISYTIS